MQGFYIFSENGFADGFSLGDTQAVSSVLPIGGSSGYDPQTNVINFSAPDGYSQYRLLSPVVDVTNYSALYVKCNAGGTEFTKSVDVSSISGDKYIETGIHNIDRWGIFVKSATGTYANDNSVANTMNTVPSSSITISAIWLE